MNSRGLPANGTDVECGGAEEVRLDPAGLNKPGPLPWSLNRFCEKKMEHLLRNQRWTGKQAAVL